MMEQGNAIGGDVDNKEFLTLAYSIQYDKLPAPKPKIVNFEWLKNA